jgi:hypothetical protein
MYGIRVESQIYGVFTGWHQDALFKLTDGQYWLQDEYKYCYHYHYRPMVVITRTAAGYEMEAEGMDDSVRVRRVNVVESRINDEFTGWSGDTEFSLQNGQVWQQSSYAYWYHYAYRPEVIIYESDGGYKLRLSDDDSHSVSVRRIR